jgi:hypothetical protein
MRWDLETRRFNYDERNFAGWCLKFSDYHPKVLCEMKLFNREYSHRMYSDIAICIGYKKECNDNSYTIYICCNNDVDDDEYIIFRNFLPFVSDCLPLFGNVIE